MGGEGDAMSAAMVGGVVVGASLAAAVILCTSLCLALWCRRLRGNAGDPSPATFLVTKRKPGQEFIPDHPMALVLPTITQSEADSEPQTPTPTSTLTPTSEYAKRGGLPPYTQGSRPNDPDATLYPRLAALASPPIYSPLPAYSVQYTRTTQRPRSASPRSLLPSSPRTPPLSLPLGARRWQSATRPSSPLTPGTPPGLPSRSYLRKGVAGLEDLRAALHHSFVTSELGSGEALEVSTPDSIEGWAPVWTPASSVGSGGGCGLGEVRLRLRYTVRTRLLHLLLYSADQLPLRLGPDPVATYTKAVLLPEKRVRFTTPWVAATDTAVFNASFTHPTRPSRLANATLRLSVCQVTGCGRRVVVGYCAVNLASIGMRSGLTSDIDTGLLALHLQETAPDQQVGVGGQLRMGLKWDTEAGVLTIRITCVSGLQLLHLQPPLQDNVQAYVKVTVYVNNTILCWRRSGPRAVAAVMEVEEDLTLCMPELDLDATHLVLSVRLRTRPGGGRRVVGSCLVGRGGCVGEDGRHHWEDMLRAAPDFVTRIHPLTAHHDPAAHPTYYDDQEWRLDMAGAASPHSQHNDHCVQDSASSAFPTSFTSSAISNRPLILPTPRKALPLEGSSPSSPSTFLNSSSALTLTTTTPSSPSALTDPSRAPSSSTSLSSPSALISPTSAHSSSFEFSAPTVTFSSSEGFASPSSTPSSPLAFNSPSPVLSGHTVGSRGSASPLPGPTPPRSPTPTTTLSTLAAPTPPLSPTLPPISTLSPAPTLCTDTTTAPDNTLAARHPHLHPPPAPPPSPSHSRPISQHRTL